MTVYGPDIETAIEAYASQFDDLQVVQRENIIDLNAINPTSDLRDDWQNVQSDQTEHRLQTSASTDDIAYLYTEKRGQYTAGYEAQAGLGTRIPTKPSNDEELRWGYFEEDATHGLLNGWCFGVDSTDVFVAEASNGTVNKVYRDDWNIDVCDGTNDAETNPSGFDLSLSKGNIFQIKFVYYGYGPVKMQILTDSGKVTVHEFYHDGATSVENTNLSMSAQIVSNGTNSDALELYVGGRNFSVIGEKSVSERKGVHFVDTLAVDDTKWYPVTSIKVKDGTDIGSIDFGHVIGKLERFSADSDAAGYRWQVRRETTPDNPIWETPYSHQDTPDETAMKVDTNSTSITDGSGNLTGVFVDGGTLASGTKNDITIGEENPTSEITNGTTVTVIVRNKPTDSGTLNELVTRWTESW